MVMMSYSYYILIMGEVNKYMYNYSILANCRARTGGNKNTRDKIDKNQSENLQKLYRIAAVLQKNALTIPIEAVYMCIVYIIYAIFARICE